MKRNANVARLVSPRILKRTTNRQPLTAIDPARPSIDMPEELAPIPREIKKTFARGNPAERDHKFRLYAEADFHAQTQNVENTFRDILPDYEERYYLAQAHNLELARKANAADAVDITHSHQDAGTDRPHARRPMGSWLRQTFGTLKPPHQIKLAMLGVTGFGVSTIGASSILSYLMEYSDFYASYPTATIPLMAVPVGAGVGLELILEKLESQALRKRAESWVSVTCLAAVGVWLAGLVDMGSDAALSLAGGGFSLPKGLRASAQIVFEITAITLITSAIFGTLRDYWSDELSPGAENRARNQAVRDHNTDVLEPLADEVKQTKLLIKPYEAAREKFVLRECADFELVCADYDAWAQ